MASQPIDGIVESLVTGGLGIDDFMREVQREIEVHEADSAREDHDREAQSPARPPS
jgi:hypothetical protein